MSVHFVEEVNKVTKVDTVTWFLTRYFDHRLDFISIHILAQQLEHIPQVATVYVSLPTPTQFLSTQKWIGGNLLLNIE